jgi:hypothetical protein
MRGARVFWILFAVAALAAILLAAALKHQEVERRERLHRIGPIPATH